MYQHHHHAQYNMKIAFGANNKMTTTTRVKPRANPAHAHRMRGLAKRLLSRAAGLASFLFHTAVLGLAAAAALLALAVVGYEAVATHSTEHRLNAPQPAATKTKGIRPDSTSQCLSKWGFPCVFKCGFTVGQPVRTRATQRSMIDRCVSCFFIAAE